MPQKKIKLPLRKVKPHDRRNRPFFIDTRAGRGTGASGVADGWCRAQQCRVDGDRCAYSLGSTGLHRDRVWLLDDRVRDQRLHRRQRHAELQLLTADDL